MMVYLIPALFDEETGAVGVDSSTDTQDETALSRCFEDKDVGTPRSPSPDTQPHAKS